MNAQAFTSTRPPMISVFFVPVMSFCRSFVTPRIRPGVMALGSDDGVA